MEAFPASSLKPSPAFLEAGQVEVAECVYQEFRLLT